MRACSLIGVVCLFGYALCVSLRRVSLLVVRWLWLGLDFIWVIGRCLRLLLMGCGMCDAHCSGCVIWVGELGGTDVGLSGTCGNV